MSETQTAPEPQVKVWREGSAGRLRLNRPAALNALTLDMVRLIDQALTAWENDPAVALVILDGEGPRALCAGGDVRALYEGGKRRNDEGPRFWTEEYRLNARIAKYPKPYVAFMDGIVMGGGVGISAHGSHRIVTETTVIAMPEVGIGFFPDVGGSLLLARAPGELGLALGLTGDRFGASDAILACFADLMVERARWPEICAALAALPPSADGTAVTQLLQSFATSAAPGPWAAAREVIDHLFARDSVAAILAALDAAGTEFAVKTAATLRKKSPTSLKLAFKLIREARALTSLEQALTIEYRLAVHALESGTDFFEGVRATLIDKGQTPQWQPPTLDQVGDDIIERHFASLGERDIRFN